MRDALGSVPDAVSHTEPLSPYLWRVASLTASACSTTAYAAEICPAALRPFLTTYVNLCWVMGQFISSGVLKGVSTLSEDDQWAWRIPLVLAQPLLSRSAQSLTLSCSSLFQLRPAVGLAHSHPRRCLVRARVSLVACP